MDVLMRILYPFTIPFTPTTNFYWLYLFSAFGLATLLYIFKLTNQNNPKNLLEYLFPKEIYLYPSFINQCKYYFLTCWCFIFVLLPGIEPIQNMLKI